MKLRNRKTGQIGNFIINKDHFECADLDYVPEYGSLAELNEEWEDYEEPKGSALDLMILTIINFIENEPDEDKVDLEDCKQMIEKLKAVKRLKDKGFRFIPEFHRIEEGDDERGNIMFIACTMNDDKDFIYGDNKDLKLLFGGKE